MKNLSIRPATSSDIPLLIELDHGFGTDHVWQMAYNQAGQEVSVSFREVRLPRPMRVKYPREPRLLIDRWVDHMALLIAVSEGRPIGYIALIDGPGPKTAWVTDLVVGLPNRRQGVGSSLIRKAGALCREHGYARMFMEMQSKNYPAICLAKKVGMRFSGYSDNYYPDQDITLFFSLNLHNSS
jgi:ribosomal protein S18 acetylase RimI-like enzyme